MISCDQNGVKVGGVSAVGDVVVCDVIRLEWCEVWHVSQMIKMMFHR